MKPYYDNLVEATNNLNILGYTEDFEAQTNSIVALYSKKEYQPEDLTIEKSYRFFSNSDVGDEAELFVITANDGTKGTLSISYSAQETENLSLIKRMKSI